MKRSSRSKRKTKKKTCGHEVLLWEKELWRKEVEPIYKEVTDRDDQIDPVPSSH